MAGLALRTRSKQVKSLICKALGYSVPKSFLKTQPRFLGQNFDVYTQKANNLQIWNEDIDPERRYVLIIVGETDVIINVFVLTGIDLATLDATGTLTQKYQARLINSDNEKELISLTDTSVILGLIPTDSDEIDLLKYSPVDVPTKTTILPISSVFEKLSVLVGVTTEHLGFTQERNRGAGLHKLICQALGYADYHDNGRFPDVRHQLLEVKLQTSTTIDLGLICPDSEALLDIDMISGNQVRHCDVRYAIFYGIMVNDAILITNFYLTTGKDFFLRFPKFGGKTINKKIQLHLPRSFFSIINQAGMDDLPVQDDE